MSRKFLLRHKPFGEELLFKTVVGDFDKLVNTGWFISALAWEITDLVSVEEKGTLVVFDCIFLWRKEGKFRRRIHFLLRTNFHYMVKVSPERINRLRQCR